MKKWILLSLCLFYSNKNYGAEAWFEYQEKMQDGKTVEEEFLSIDPAGCMENYRLKSEPGEELIMTITSEEDPGEHNEADNQNEDLNNFISAPKASVVTPLEIITIRPAETGYKCPECSKDFSGKAGARSSLARHLKVHRKKAIFMDKCPQCNKEFSNRHLYNQHVAVHRNQQ